MKQRIKRFLFYIFSYFNQCACLNSSARVIALPFNSLNDSSKEH